MAEIEQTTDRQKAEELLTDQTNSKITDEQIAEQTHYSIQHIKRLKRNLKIKSAQPIPTKDEELQPEKIVKVDLETPTLIQVKEKAAKPEEEPKTKAKTEIIGKQIAGLFKAANSLLPQKYRRSEDQLDLLGSFWENPLNRMLGKFADENMDVYLAIVATVIVFSPVPIEMIRDKREAEAKKLEGQ